MYANICPDFCYTCFDTFGVFCTLYRLVLSTIMRNKLSGKNIEKYSSGVFFCTGGGLNSTCKLVISLWYITFLPSVNLLFVSSDCGQWQIIVFIGRIFSIVRNYELQLHSHCCRILLPRIIKKDLNHRHWWQCLLFFEH